MSIPMRTIRSLIPGDTANARRFMNVPSGTAGTSLYGAPGASEKGLSTQNAETLHVFKNVTGSSPSYELQFWYRNPDIDDGTWRASASTVTVTDNSPLQININGLAYVYIQIVAEAAAADSLELWLGHNAPSGA